MKTTISVLATTTALGTAAAAVSDLPALANFPAAPVFAASAALGILALFVRDYRRTVRPLHVPARILRPVVPTSTAALSASPRTSAYRVQRRSALVERTAA